MKTVALLTGRGNNSLKDKNILDICGRPVMYYPAHAGALAKHIDSYYCSSDDEKILDMAESEGYERIVRPKELALPSSQHIDAIMHALNFIEKKDKMPDILVVILANNVTIKSAWIEECVQIMKDDMSISSVVPIYEDNDHHPLRGKRIVNGRIEMFEKEVKGDVSTNRQDLEKCYFLAHNFWVINVKKLIESKGEGQPPWKFLGDNIAYFEIDESIDIHKEMDLISAKYWIERNYTD